MNRANEVKTIVLADLTGKTVKTVVNPQEEVYLGDLERGVYLLTMTMNDGSIKTIKTVKK